MTAGRIALGPIGVAASLLTLPIGAAIAGNKEKNYIRKANEVAGQMTRLEGILDRCRNRMMPLHVNNQELHTRESTVNLGHQSS